MAGNHYSGFASMTKAERQAAAKAGGIAAHRKKVAHQWTPEEAREAGRKGGLARKGKRVAAAEDEAQRQAEILS